LGGDAAPERIPAQGCGSLVAMAPVLELAREPLASRELKLTRCGRSSVR
jgi:hypothetical protein